MTPLPNSLSGAHALHAATAEYRLALGEFELAYLIAEDVAVFRDQVQRLSADGLIIVTSSTPEVRAISETIARALAPACPTAIVAVAESEAAKTMQTVEQICQTAIAGGTTRASCIVGVGGGIVCNIAGVCASLLYRGIRLIQVPTTLLAMSDAVLSLKQAVNLSGLKNGIGTYYGPTVVWANPRVLRTVPPAGIRAGLAEIIKNALAIDPDQVAELRSLLRAEADYPASDLRTLIEMAIRAKQRVLAYDGHERGAALVLEYGHTVGHALELLTEGAISHGAGVALGMRVASRVAFERGSLAWHDVQVHDELLELAGIDRTLASQTKSVITEASLRAQLRLDNKRGYVSMPADAVAMVLLTALGAPTPTPIPLTPVPIDVVVRIALDTLF